MTFDAQGWPVVTSNNFDTTETEDLPDTDPPTPDPMTWQQVPETDDTSSVSMGSKSQTARNP